LNVVHVFENYNNCNEYPVTCYICNEYSQPWAYGHTTLEQHKFMSVGCCGVEAYANRFNCGCG
jgi:hypothetical protein